MAMEKNKVKFGLNKVHLFRPNFTLFFSIAI